MFNTMRKDLLTHNMNLLAMKSIFYHSVVNQKGQALLIAVFRNSRTNLTFIWASAHFHVSEIKILRVIDNESTCKKSNT